MSLRNALASRILRPSRKIESLSSDVVTLRADVTAWKQKADGWKRQVGQKSRRVLRTHVLQDIFDLRERTLSARTAIPPREQREAILREVSAAGASLADVCAKVQQHFTHCIDLNGDIMGPRRQEIDKLPQSLAYMAESRSQTDVLFYCASR